MPKNNLQPKVQSLEFPQTLLSEEARIRRIVRRILAEERDRESTRIVNSFKLSDDEEGPPIDRATIMKKFILKKFPDFEEVDKQRLPDTSFMEYETKILLAKTL